MEKFMLKAYQLMAFLMGLDLVVLAVIVMLKQFFIPDIDPVYGMTALLIIPLIGVVAIGFSVVDLVSR